MESPKSTETNDKPTETPPSKFMAQWSIFTIIGSIFCILAFFGAILLRVVPVEYFLLVSLVSVLFGQAQLSGIFAGLGSDRYFVRLAVSQLFLTSVMFAFFGGLMIGQSAGNELPFAFALFGLAASHATQFVFGLFRIFGGWRLHRKGTDRGPSYDLKDLFALMLFLAVSLSFLNSAVTVFGNENAASMFAYLYMTVGIAIATLVYAVPTFIAVFRTNNFENGCTAQIIFVVTLLFLVGTPTLALGAPTEAVGAVGAVIVGCCISTWLPLVILRENGFVLTNGKEPSKPQVLYSGKDQESDAN